MHFSTLKTSALLLSIWALFTNYRDPNNPPVARTGAPGETTCGASGCHNGGSFVGTVALSGLPDTVTVNQNYTVTLTNTSNAVRAGFQLTCLSGTSSYVGTLTNGVGTSIGTNNSTGRKYIRQSSPKNLSGGAASWTFTWKAPASAPGDSCKMYFVSLCANGNGEKDGDNVLVSSKKVVLRAVSAAPEAAESAKTWVYFQAPTGQHTLTINLLKTSQGRLEVFDLQGKLVLQTNLSAENQVDISRLAGGVYAASVRAAGQAASFKFVRQ